MMKEMCKTEKLIRVRHVLTVFIICLVLSGITAFPIEWQLHQINKVSSFLNMDNDFSKWISTVFGAVQETNSKFPFLSYGTDWLAFAHLVIAILFIGAIKDAVRNIWVIEFGMIACVCIFPMAFVAGFLRGIPFFWQLIDCSFGVLGGLLLFDCYKICKVLEYGFHKD